MKRGDEETSDEDLAARVQESAPGDLRAFEELVRRYQDKVTTNCRYLTGSPTDAEDLAQEVFVKAYFGLRRFEGRSTFGTWLQRIKVNHCLNFNEAAKRRTFLDVDSPGMDGNSELQVGPRGEQELIAREERELVREVLDSLNETLRVPLILRDMDSLSYQEIADRLGIGLSAVKMRIKRAREEFRRLYGTRVQHTEPSVDEVAIIAEADAGKT